MNRLFPSAVALVLLSALAISSTPSVPTSVARSPLRVEASVDALAALDGSTRVPVAELSLAAPADVYVQFSFDAAGGFQNRASAACSSYTDITGMQLHVEQGDLSGDGTGFCSQLCGGALAAYQGTPYDPSPGLTTPQGFSPGSDHHGMICGSGFMPAQYVGRFAAGSISASLSGYDMMYDWISNAENTWHYNSPSNPSGHVPYARQWSRYRVGVRLLVVPVS